MWLTLALIFALATVAGVFFARNTRKQPGSSTETRHAEKRPPKEKTEEKSLPKQERKSIDPVKLPPDEEKPPSPPPPVLDDTGAALVRLNAARETAGLPGVVLDSEARGETLRLGKPTAAAIEALLADPASRIRLLDPNLTRVTLGEQMILDTTAAARTTAIVFPADGQKEVPPAFPGNEVPDPVPLSKDRMAGFPITATFPERTRIRNAEGRLFDADGKEVAAWFSSPEKPANPAFRVHQGTSLCLIAQTILQHGANYTAEMSAEVGGQPWSQRWSFTTLTREKETEGMARRLLTELNAARKSAGLSQLVLDEDLSRSCRAHALYITRNAGHADLNLNDEDPKLPGATPEGRRVARAAHISTAPFDPGWLVGGWLASFHYRFPLLDREARSIGIGAARGARDWYGVLVLGDPGPASQQPFVYPGDDQTNVALEYESGEKPDPIPESKDRRAGFPISLMFPERARVRQVSATLRLTGEDVLFWMSTPERPVARGMQHNTVCLIAQRPLQPDSRYQVKVSATVDGKPFEKTWSFHTRPAVDSEEAVTATRATARVNHHRRLAGLPPVELDVDLSRGCRLHAQYLLANLDHPSTRGLGMHNEDPKLPGYTPEGKKAGADSVIAGGMPPIPSVDDWLATFYHRIPLLDPALGRIGFGYVKGGPVGWFVVLNATAGKGREAAIIYPGDGQKDVPTTAKDGGYPLTVTFVGKGTMKPAEAVLRGSDGNEVSVRLSALESTLVIAPREALKPGSGYTMRLSGALAGKPWSRTWTFSTSSK